jgi:hypothetical protein
MGPLQEQALDRIGALDRSKIPSRDTDRLLKFIKDREKALKTKARYRAQELMAQFEKEISRIYYFDEDAVWDDAMKSAQEAIANATEMVRKHCTALGIPREFQPSLHGDLMWFDRGRNALNARRNELRRVAATQVNALETKACAKIEELSLDAQGEILKAGLESANAQKMIQNLRSASLSSLMPELNVQEMKKLVAPSRHRLRHDDDDDDGEEAG